MTPYKLTPRTYIPRDTDISEEDYEHLEQSYYSEDDAMERDIRDSYEDDNNPDDLEQINIG